MGKQSKRKQQKKGFGQFTQATEENAKSLLEGIPQEILKNHNVFSLGYIAWQCYKTHGKGICAYAQKKPFYYLNNSRVMQDIDRALLESYDPQKEFVVTAPLDDNDVNGLWATENLSYSNEKAKARIIIPKEISLQTFINKSLCE